MLLIAVVFTVFASVVAWGFGRIGRSLIADTPRLQGLYEQATVWLETHGIVVAGLWAEHFDMRWIVGAVQGLSARLNTMISFWIVVLIYVLLGLLEVGPMARRIPSIVGSEAARILIVGGNRTAAKLRRYLMIRTIMSVATGGMVYLFALALGLRLAAEWGVIAFILEFHSLRRPVHRNAAADLLRIGAVRIPLFRAVRLCLPQSHPVRDRQLRGAARGGQSVGDVALSRAVFRLPVDVSLGPVRRLHRGSDCNRPADLLRPVSFHQMGCPTVGAPEDEVESVERELERARATGSDL